MPAPGVGECGEGRGLRLRRGDGPFSVRTGCRGSPAALRGSSRGISLFPWARGVAGSQQDAPPILSPGERMRRARWKRGARGTLSMGFPWTLPRRHKEGGPACPPSLESPPLGDGGREPPSHGQKAVPAPLLRKGGHPRFIVRSQQEGDNPPPTAKVRQRKEKLGASLNSPNWRNCICG